MMYIRSLLHRTSSAVPIVSMTRKLHRNVKIIASPRVALNDVVPRIRVEGLAPKTGITLKTEMFDQKGRQLLSNAHYVSAEDGSVDVTTAHSVGGSYKGIFPTGLISNLSMVDSSQKYRQLVHDNIDESLHIKITLHEGHEQLLSTAPSLGHVNLERHLITPGVKRILVREGRIRGVLFIPAGEGVFPGVIDMHGAIGILIESRGALLASRGIASLCLAYFKHDDIPNSKVLSPDIEYFEEATEFLTSHPQVIPDRCGVLGNCQGGLLGNAMAIEIDKVKALFGINFFLRHLGMFTRNGKDMYNKDRKPIIITHAKDFELLKGSTEQYVLSKESIRQVNCPEGSFAKHLSKVSKEKYFSYAYGEDDTYGTMNGIEGIKKVVGKDFDTNFEVKIYPSVGHMIYPPYSVPLTERYIKIYSKTAKNNEEGFKLYEGGKIKEIVSAQEDVWQNIQKFFNYHIRDNSLWYQNWLQRPGSSNPNKE